MRITSHFKDLFFGVIAMSVPSFFTCRNATPPWEGFPSIYSFITENLDSSTEKLVEKADKLPDETRRFKPNDMRWVAGGMDNAMGHHGNPGNDKKNAKKIANFVKSISISNRLNDKIALYNLLKDDNIIDYIDPALQNISTMATPIDPYFHKFAIWLCKESPDRGPVKFGISLLGIIADSNDIPIVTTLAKHEEFTLYSVVAITNSIKNPDHYLWQVAKSVDGWGKIATVERLYKTTNPIIKHWLLTEGYKNSIMYEYLAYKCAVGGELAKELQMDNLEDTLLSSAGEIIQALITGGPAESIEDYNESFITVSSYLQKIQSKVNSLSEFNIICSIHDFLIEPDSNWEPRYKNGWSKENRLQLSNITERILQRNEWIPKIKSNLKSKDAMVFSEAERAAHNLKMDLSDIYWERLRENPSESGRWYNIMQIANSQNIDEIVNIAQKNIPLDKINTGPSTSMGLGLEYNAHSCLNFILQDIGKFPGHGYELIKIGLNSPVIRNRNMAAKALSNWGKDNWPSGAATMLKKAIEIEPDTGVKKYLNSVLTGKEGKAVRG